MGTDPVLLDTHVWAHYQDNAAVLRPKALAAIDGAAALGLVFVSPISIWELAMLEKAGRIALDQGVRHWVKKALSFSGIQLVPYSPAIAIESVYLPEPMHKDPSDRIIVASAIIENMTLITADKAILAFAKHIGLAHVRA